MRNLYKQVLIYGLGISGISSAKTFSKLGSEVYIYDKNKNLIENILDKYKDFNFKVWRKKDITDIDLLIKSPGIFPDDEILESARSKNIEIKTDLEIAGEFFSEKNMVAITGTNGKTTTTSLVGEIYKMAKLDSKVLGNIGTGMLWEMYNSNPSSNFIIECSSFQLEDTKMFKPHISCILNLSPDHLDYHKTVDKYYNAKKKIVINQDSNDFCILNYDDIILRKFANEIKSKIVFVSINERIEEGICCIDNIIYINNEEFMKRDSIKLLGDHNIYNCMMAIAISICKGIDLEIIKDTLKEFRAIEHRIEFVKEVNGVKYYNDSKGTNIDSTKKAILAMQGKTILIAGGYDKNIEFDDLFNKYYLNKINDIILMGQTAIKIDKTAKKYDFKNTHIVKNMIEAVDLASQISKKGMNVLLSPACASWGMYKNYKERGKDFKSCVNHLK